MQFNLLYHTNCSKPELDLCIQFLKWQDIKMKSFEPDDAIFEKVNGKYMIALLDESGTLMATGFFGIIKFITHSGLIQ